MNTIHDRITDSYRQQGFLATIGAQLISVADGEVQIELPFSASLTQQNGYIHAGVITSIVDTACGYAALTRAPAGYGVLTVEFKINFMRPAVGERFLATGRVLNSGRLLAVCSGEVRAFSGTGSKVIAVMQSTIAHVRA